MRVTSAAALAVLLSSSVAPAALAANPPAPPLQAGGLTPVAGPSTSGPSAVQEDLERADREDSGRGLEWLWAEGEVGGTYVGLSTFHANSLIDSGTIASNQGGVVVGVGAGLRLVFITLGARFRNAWLSDFNLWSLDGELGLHVPLGAIDQALTLAGGYTSTSSFSPKDLLTGDEFDVDIWGANARVGYSIDYYFLDWLSLGLDLTGEALFLKRKGAVPELPVPGVQVPDSVSQIYEHDGSSVGGAFTGTLVVGAHL